ncbi:MAG: DUF2321 domain-containing protein [Ignavibacteriales bacterium]|nr:DUF2321 domain-containing protein [Ignavibacteriales bacterium]
MEGYDVAQICLNGHCTNSSFKSFPEFNQDYCDKCGEQTITLCPACKSPIRVIIIILEFILQPHLYHLPFAIVAANPSPG